MAFVSERHMLDTGHDTQSNRVTEVSVESKLTNFLRNQTSRTIRDVIRTQCGLVNMTVMEKWLPLSHVRADEHRNVLHVAFIGDSLSYRQFRFTVIDMALCLDHLGLTRPTLKNCTFSRAPPSAFAAFTLHPPAHPDPVSLPLDGEREARTMVDIEESDLVAHARHNSRPEHHMEETRDTHGTRDEVPVNTRMIFTYHRIRYSVQLRETLEHLYAPDEELSQAMSLSGPAPVTHGWPSFPPLPAPAVLYTTVGIWDSTRPCKLWDGFDVLERDWYLSLEDYHQVTAAFIDHMAQNFTQPMASLVDRWVSPSSSARHGAPGKLTPPAFYTLSVSPRVNCSANKFQPRPPSGPEDVYQHVLTPSRCSALLLPTYEAVRDGFLNLARMLGQGVQGRNEGIWGDSPASTTFKLVDWSADDLKCRRSDGVHLDDATPACREIISQTFWEQFW